MRDTGWRFLKFKPDDTGSAFKSHAVCVELRDQIIGDLETRDGKPLLEDCKTLDEYGMDFGGLAHMDRPYLKFEFFGMHLNLPSEHVLTFLGNLRQCPRRFFSDHTVYFKLHSHWSCLVLTEEQRDVLVRLFEEAAPQAEAAALAFYGDKQPTNVILAQAAKASTGLDLPPKALGVDRQARFRGERGKA